MVRIIDLTLPMRGHFKWELEINRTKSFSAGDPFQMSFLSTTVHGFTHIDAPLHFVEGGESIDWIPLDRLIGRATIIDLSFKRENEPIGEFDLEKSGADLNDSQIAILKTNWGEKYSWEGKDYWLESPFLDESAAQWLVKKRVTAIGYDFPQEFITRLSGDHPKRRDSTGFTIHNTILKAGILNIEYLTNLSAIRREKVTIVALPLKIEGCEGAPARVVAIED